ncbi:DUF4382 domain-containing protein [Geotalea sp. SG265]|uniref:DUF4382 domain-containing protein n=1 Tax=Geotalea sp. SG265 TaxID=2922867 RepID=UPI001FAF06FC|nr:DUF4382 domain-containing protein [Geotalea sp. SG265]
MLKKVRSLWGLALAVLLALAVSQLPGCGGGGSSPPTGTLKVGLTDAQSDNFAHVFITIKEVRVVPAGLESAEDSDPRLPVIATFAVPLQVDILQLRFLQKTLGEAVLPAGNYNQVRLVLIPNEGNNLANYVELNTGGKFALDTNSGVKSGLKVVGKINVRAGVINAIAVDFDPNTAIVITGSTPSNQKYILKPTGIRIVRLATPLPELELGTSTSFGSLTGYVSTLGNWSTATVSVVPQASSTAIAAGSIFANATSGGPRVPFSAFVPSGTYRVHVDASGFLPYSTPLQTVTAGNSTAVSIIDLLK